MGRLWVALTIVLGACSFSGSGGADPDSRPGAPDARRIDARPGEPDAPFDAAPDAPVDADPCQAPFTRTVHGCHAFGAVGDSDWAGGRSGCQAIGGDLAIVQNVGESGYLATAIAPGNTSGRVWIGLSGTTTNGDNWVWIDGQTVSQAGFSNWVSGEPDGAGCAVVRPGASGFWAARGCGEVFTIVCER